MIQSDFIIIHPNDNVAVALKDIKKGTSFNGVIANDNIPFGHKMLLTNLKAGDNVIKYGYPIGHVTQDTPKGSYVHTHKIATNIKGKLNYEYKHDNSYHPVISNKFFNGYVRKNGEVGIRNKIIIIPTVGCVNDIVKKIENNVRNIFDENFDGIFAYTHPYGCSQVDNDQDNTIKVLTRLIKHSNVGGALVVSLGCENCNIEVIKKALGRYDEKRIKFLVCQDVEDEIKSGKELIKQIYDVVKNDKKEKVNLSKLKIGYKCGGSDAFSGLTANRLCGEINNRLTDLGATTVLTEVPEMFGAEQILLDRSLNKNVFNKQVEMINSFKDYFIANGQGCADNPSPGNHKGGITTLEEKSLGCVQKGGKSIVTDVLKYGENAHKNGLNLLIGPGNDIVSVTNLVCAGCQVILFTTGRGTSLGAAVPTIKISSNSALFERKSNWIDFNAGELINGIGFDVLADELQNKLLAVLNGEKTKNELNNYRDISVFKDGVIM